jgi:hypothetical protein
MKPEMKIQYKLKERRQIAIALSCVHRRRQRLIEELSECEKDVERVGYVS